MGFAFYNYVLVGADNEDFTDDAGAQVITNGLYRFDEFIEAFIATWSKANRRVALSADGFLTLSTSDASNFSITWAGNGYLRDLMGFTADLAAANSYAAPRRVRCAYAAVRATLREHDPQPTGTVRQTRSLGGVTRTTWMGQRTDMTEFGLQFLDNTSRLVSPSGAVATTYANAVATELGLTEYTHTRDFWSDATSVANQGWCDGRPVTYFGTASDAAFTMTAGAAPAWDGDTTFSEWVFLEPALSAFPRAKVNGVASTLYSLSLPAVEYVAP